MRFLLLLLFTVLFGNAMTFAQLTSDYETVDVKTFTKVEVEAEFPGGDLGWRKFLMKNLKYKNIGRKIKFEEGETEIKQSIIVKFIVDKDGSLSEIMVENKDANPLCIAEAIRVISLSPNWTAAKQNNRPVRAYRRQTISFLFQR